MNASLGWVVWWVRARRQSAELGKDLLTWEWYRNLKLFILTTIDIEAIKSRLPVWRFIRIISGFLDPARWIFRTITLVRRNFWTVTRTWWKILDHQAGPVKPLDNHEGRWNFWTITLPRWNLWTISFARWNFWIVMRVRWNDWKITCPLWNLWTIMWTQWNFWTMKWARWNFWILGPSPLDRHGGPVKLLDSEADQFKFLDHYAGQIKLLDHHVG